MTAASVNRITVFFWKAPYKTILDFSVSACETLEQGILAAHYDGRVSALNNLFGSYRQALSLEYGRNFNLIAKRMNELVQTIEAQGDWGGWVSNLRSLRDILQSDIASSADGTRLTNGA
jgi:hypothetical protein